MAVLWALLGGAAPALAIDMEAGTTTERVLVDQATGFAIGGLDPVAYFIDRRPVEGLRGVEATYEGAIWRFASKGNRNAFVDAPDLYVPQYGGHCARSVALGIAAEADPRVFAVYRGRLYFFRREWERARWLAAPDEHIAAAARNWPRLIGALAR
jgi:YHS domain-containing protein